MWFIFLMFLHYVHSRPSYDNPPLNTKHCIKMSPAKDKEITTILAKFTDFLDKIADEHENIDIPFINIHIENHSDDESEEKDTKLRVVINDCHDFTIKNSNSKIIVDKELKEDENKNFKADQENYHELPSNETLLEIIEKLTKENIKLKDLLYECNKVTADVREIDERKLMFGDNNKQLLISNTDNTSENEVTVSMEKGEDITDEKNAAIDNNIENILKIPQDLIINNSFEIMNEPRIERLSEEDEFNSEENKSGAVINSDNNDKIAERVLPNITKIDISVPTIRDHWKNKFMTIIEKVLDETVSNIQFIENNNNNFDSDVFIDDLFAEKSKINDNNLNSNYEKDISMKQYYNNHKNHKNDLKISEQKLDRQEKHISNVQQTKTLNPFNQLDDFEEKYSKEPTNGDEVDCEHDKTEDYNSNTKSEQNDLKNKFKFYFNAEDDQLDNNYDKIHTEIANEVSNRDSKELIEDTIIISNTYPDNVDEYAANNNQDNKADIGIDCVESTDNTNGILVDMDDLLTNIPVINNADIISVNVDTEDSENKSQDSDKQGELNEVLSADRINSTDEENIPVNKTIYKINTNNDALKDSCEDNGDFHKNQQSTERYTTENTVIDTEDLNKDNNDSSEETTEEPIALELKLPEILPLSLEENGEEILQIIERKSDKSNPLWVYIQEKKEQNEYVFFSKI